MILVNLSRPFVFVPNPCELKSMKNAFLTSKLVHIEFAVIKFRKVKSQKKNIANFRHQFHFVSVLLPGSQIVSVTFCIRLFVWYSNQPFLTNWIRVTILCAENMYNKKAEKVSFFCLRFPQNCTFSTPRKSSRSCWERAQVTNVAVAPRPNLDVLAQPGN